MNNFQIAWRNLWRNKRRTFITVAAVFLAVLLSTFMGSMQVGTYTKMIDNVVKFYSGYLQIHHADYWESKSINDVFAPDDSLQNLLDSIPEIAHYVPRMESFTLISTGENTKGAALIGIDPTREDKLTGLSQWVKQGKYLQEGGDGVLVPVNLAKTLKVEIGDTLVLMSQGYHGASAAGLFPVRGILEFPSPQLNSFAAYITLESARYFFSAPEMATSMVIMVEDYSHVKSVNQALQKALGKHYNSKTWDEMQPEVKQMIESDRAGGVIMKAILFIVIGFGIFGTVIMMVSERRRELGIMIAIGMQKYKLQIILFFETVLIGLIGVVLGFLLSVPFISYFVNNPIPLPEETAKAYEQFGFEPVMYFGMNPELFLNQVLIVFVITFVISFYPVVRIARMNLTKALRN